MAIHDSATTESANRSFLSGSSDSPWAEIRVMAENPFYPGQQDNETHTTRYTALNFVPLTLFENLRIMSNIYFLIVLVVCFLPWSPVSYIFQLTPVLFVFLVSMAKSAIEDTLKRREDNIRNHQVVVVKKGDKWEETRAADIKVGDMIQIREDSMIPSDLLYVGSEHSDGICLYSETNLNGETAVKSMTPHPAFADGIPDTIYLGSPDRNLTKFDGTMRFGDKIVPFSINNVLLRGACTHYTQNVVGIVLRTGHDCKIMMNMRHPPAKMTDFDTSMNTMLVLIFVFKLIVCALLSGAGVILERSSDFKTISEVIPKASESYMQYFVQNFILYSYLIPISLTVTIELIRLFHKILISKDISMRHPEFGKAIAHNSNVIGQLGQITHILSDKTGTLTENIMELTKYQTDDGLYLKDSAEYSVELLTAMDICNTAVVHTENGSEHHYSSESPDEVAFIQYAHEKGVVLEERSDLSMSISAENRKFKFKILALIPFSSSRSRMSVLVEDEQNNILLYTKGADSVILPRSNSPKFEDSLKQFAEEGLRTLLFAKKTLSLRDYQNWKSEYDSALNQLVDRELALEEVAESIETGLDIIGITGIKDMLQEGVPEAVQWIKDSNIVMWMITGDKLETAVAVSRVAGIASDAQVSIHDTVIPPNATLVVTGEEALSEDHTKFVELASNCQSVVVARASPYMKAQIADILNTHGATTLAIGDGANDVGMIQVARVGVGVYGREGSQAAQASDFAIPRFKHLIRLLTVHGHWAYHRLAMTVMIMLYKNAAFCIQQLWFSLDCLASPTSLFGDFFLSVYNLLFTLVPPFSFGCFEQDIPAEMMFKYPSLFKVEKDPLRAKSLVYYILLGVYQSAACYYVVRMIMPGYSLAENGVLSYISVVYITTIQVLLWSNFWSGVMIGTVVLTILLVPVIIIIYVTAAAPAYGEIVTHTFARFNPWLTITTTTLIGILPGILLEYLIQWFSPTSRRIKEEKHKLY